MFRYQELNSSCPYAMPEELETIRSEVLKLSSSQQFVMIGCGPGVMAVAALEGHPHPPKTAIIDLNTFYYCEAHLRGAGVDPNKIWFITGDSSTIGKQWTNPIDFLIIDGDHEFAGVSKDIKAWWPHLKPGGIAFFHDAKIRDGGFNGVGEWQNGPVYQAIETYRDSSWLKLYEVGISVAYMKV